MPGPRDTAPQALLASLVVGVVSAALALAAPLRASGADTVPGRYGAAVFACRSSLDLREVDWLAAGDAAGSLPYYAKRVRDGAVVSVFGPAPAFFGAPFMEGLPAGSVLTDLELERRARHASALALGLAATLLCAALSARTSPLTAAALALATSLSFAGVPTLGQGLWQQTALMVPLMAAVATVAWASWRGGALLVLTPGFLLVAALTRPNDAIVAAAVGITWILAVRPMTGRRTLVALALPIGALLALPQLAWNASRTGDPLAIGVYLSAHTTQATGFHWSPTWFLTSLLGLAASPARGLLFFAPTVLVALYAGLYHGDQKARVLGAGIVLHILPVAVYYNWWGGWAFGPRMVTETVWLAPLLLVPIPPSRLVRNLLVGAGVVTVAVGLLGTFRYQIGVWDLRRDPDLHHEALWDAIDSPLVAMLRGGSIPTVDAPKGPYEYCVDRALRSVKIVPIPWSPRP